MLRTSLAFDDPNVKAVFDAYPSKLRGDLLRLRALIFDTASEIESVGALVETLKWGQPAYLPLKPKIGTTIRIDASKDEPDDYAMFFHCQTTLVDSFREIYRDQFAFQGNRALRFSHGEALPLNALRHCIAQSLTYHLNKRARRPSGRHADA